MAKNFPTAHKKHTDNDHKLIASQVATPTGTLYHTEDLIWITALIVVKTLYDQQGSSQGTSTVQTTQRPKEFQLRHIARHIHTHNSVYSIHSLGSYWRMHAQPHSQAHFLPFNAVH